MLMFVYVLCVHIYDTYVYMYVCMHVCIYVCVYVCMHACFIYVCVCVCVRLHTTHTDGHKHTQIHRLKTHPAADTLTHTLCIKHTIRCIQHTFIHTTHTTHIPHTL